MGAQRRMWQQCTAAHAGRRRVKQYQGPFLGGLTVVRGVRCGGIEGGGAVGTGIGLGVAPGAAIGSVGVGMVVAIAAALESRKSHEPDKHEDGSAPLPAESASSSRSRLIRKPSMESEKGATCQT